LVNQRIEEKGSKMKSMSLGFYIIPPIIIYISTKHLNKLENMKKGKLEAKFQRMKQGRSDFRDYCD
jgi:5,10-methylenetetrahydrofolate reductase